MHKLLTVIGLVLAASLSLQAQEENRDADSLRHAFGREPVPSAARRGTPYADTLDTGNPAVKVVLYSNGTYRYVKDPSLVAVDRAMMLFLPIKLRTRSGLSSRQIARSFSLLALRL